MKKSAVILLLTLLSVSVGAERHALIIGIGRYADVDNGWTTIHGDNDIHIAVNMLVANGFDKSNILTLQNEEATFVHISKAMEQLIENAHNKDLVYVHFSGHGQQITDLDGDEEDGFDEAWIPFDALPIPTTAYHGEHHITDDRLNVWLTRLREKVGSEGRIIVVSDACHAGSATRDIKEICEIRGIKAKFILMDKPSPYMHTRSIEWVSISACSDDECNRQCMTEEGIQCGSLTYALYLLRDSLKMLRPAELEASLSEKIKALVSRSQTPKVEYGEKYANHSVL